MHYESSNAVLSSIAARLTGLDIHLPYIFQAESPLFT